MDKLIALDTQWLVAINGCHAPWADTLMWYVSKSTTWLPLYALLLGLIIWRYGIQPYREIKKEQKNHYALRITHCALIIIAFALAVGGADYISSGIIKHAVCRPRPTHEPALEGMLHIVRGYTGGMYGFVSSHAANTMACALLFSLVYRNKIATCGLMLWVALNCYSRMYLGVHYPLDILGGLAVGTLTALLAYALLQWAVGRVWSRRPSSASAQEVSAGGADPATGGS